MFNVLIAGKPAFNVKIKKKKLFENSQLTLKKHLLEIVDAQIGN